MTLTEVEHLETLLNLYGTLPKHEVNRLIDEVKSNINAAAVEGEIESIYASPTKLPKRKAKEA